MKKSKLKAKASKAWILIKDCFMRCIVAFAIYVAADEAWKFGERIIEDFKMVFSGDKSGGFSDCGTVWCSFWQFIGLLMS